MPDKGITAKAPKLQAGWQSSFLSYAAIDSVFLGKAKLLLILAKGRDVPETSFSPRKHANTALTRSRDALTCLVVNRTHFSLRAYLHMVVSLEKVCALIYVKWQIKCML